MRSTLKLVFGMIGNATSTALFLSPVPTFLGIIRKGTTEEFSGLPYICTLFNCLLWVLYGTPFVKPHSLLIITINGLGVALELLYIIIFMTYANSKLKKMQMGKWIAAVVVAFAIVITVVLLGLHSLSIRQLTVGSICVVVTISMYASPLSIMGLVIKTRSVEYMPFLLSLFNFLNGVAWSGYSIITRDIFVAIPNGLGCLSGIAQLIIYMIYKNAKPVNLDEKETPPKLVSISASNSSEKHNMDANKNNTYICNMNNNVA